MAVTPPPERQRRGPAHLTRSLEQNAPFGNLWTLPETGDIHDEEDAQTPGSDGDRGSPTPGFANPRIDVPGAAVCCGPATERPTGSTTGAATPAGPTS